MASKNTKQSPKSVDLRKECMAVAKECVGTTCTFRPGKDGALHVEVMGPKGRRVQGFVSLESLAAFKKRIRGQFEQKQRR